MRIREASLPQDGEPLKSVIREYVAWLDMDLSYRGFEQEMEQFDSLFTLPSGLFLLAQAEGEIAGCVGLLRHSASTAEVKRLYVRPQFRGLKLGEKLIESLIENARLLGYQHLILDAVPQTTVAQKLYRAIGFQETPPYYANPVPGTKFFSLSLTASPCSATIMQIREATAQDHATIAMLVSESNKDVAVKFGLNAENCPKHPSFCTEAWVKADFARGEKYFILEADSKPIACVAYESPSADLAYLNRLSVLPAHRNRGVGARLVEHIVQRARSASVQTISIGVIGEHTELQRWYNKLGFKDCETKRFAHLPFSVKYMAYQLR